MAAPAGSDAEVEGHAGTLLVPDCVVFRDGLLVPEPRHLVAEEPLAVVVEGHPLAYLMCTPGHERELALGYLLTEAWVARAEDVGLLHFCPRASDEQTGQVHVRLVSGASLRRQPGVARHVYSSCSLCGAEAIAAVADDLQPLARPQVDAAALVRLGRELSAQQRLFRLTGGTHAAALLHRPADGETCVFVREDIGRHNALDKAVGAAACRGVALSQPLLLLSGRLSFEMVAKAARAGIAAVAGVSAPTALSVALARRLGMFLAGFLRGETFTVYAGQLAC